MNKSLVRIAKHVALPVWVALALPIISGGASPNHRAGNTNSESKSVEHSDSISTPFQAAKLFSLGSVRLLNGPFSPAVRANRVYLLALDPDRLLAPYRREAGLTPRKPPYGNWESMGLDGHTAGHYVSALANMIASGSDTPDGTLRRRLDYMIDELELCQTANGNGYVGGVPGSRVLWRDIAAGHIETHGFGLNGKWVPWYNLHKMFAGLRDAYLVGGNVKARSLLIRFGDWADQETASLTDEQMQTMLREEHGGMNEVLADIYAISGDFKYLRLARRFSDAAILGPLIDHQDQLTGKHANTQIPKVIGMERISALTGDEKGDSGAQFFWERVTGARSVSFGGNSVSEHFNDPRDFHGMLESREGPETCNTYNMLRLTEQLFARHPQAAYADYYERALYNHILASINPDHPGYVYFTPIRPGHYRVYSTPENCFWCCVGTGMENPGKYGEFIYARASDGYFVNLFIASVLSVPDAGLTLRQDTVFPDEERTRLTLKLKRPETFTLHLRHPGWVSPESFAVKVNGKLVAIKSEASSYVALRREWKNGDYVEIELPMRTTVESLPDGSSWYSLLRGPIVLASATGTEDLAGLRAAAGRGDHIAKGPLVSLDTMPALLAVSASALPKDIVPDPGSGPMHFRIASNAASPSSTGGVPLEPFFRLHDSRYQLYWELTTKDGLAARQVRLAGGERAKLARDAATIDSVAVGEQQSETDHSLTGEGMDSGMLDGRRWRHGRWIQYVLDTRGEKAIDLVVTYSGSDNNRSFDIFADGSRIATQKLTSEMPRQFVEKRYSIPTNVLTSAKGGNLEIRFAAGTGLAGGVYDIRLMRPESATGIAPQNQKAPYP